MQAVRELLEPCCDPGAIVRYRGLTLEKPVAECDHQTWIVTNGDGWLETINVGAIATATELKARLDELADEHGHFDCECQHCQRSVPSD